MPVRITDVAMEHIIRPKGHVRLIYYSMTSVTSCGYDSRTATCGQPIDLAA